MLEIVLFVQYSSLKISMDHHVDIDQRHWATRYIGPIKWHNQQVGWIHQSESRTESVRSSYNAREENPDQKQPANLVLSM